MKFQTGQRLLILAMIIAGLGAVQGIISMIRPDIINQDLSLYLAIGATSLAVLIFIIICITD